MQAPVPITFCITELDPGGAERALWQICRRLDRTLWAPDVVCLGPEAEIAEWMRSSDIPTTCLGINSSRDILKSRTLIRHLRERGSVILQTFLYHANLIGRFSARRARTPIVVSGIRVAEQRSTLRLKVDGWTRNLVSHHLCVSESVRQFTAQHSNIPLSDLTVIPNGVDIEQFGDRKRESDSPVSGGNRPLNLLFVGRLDEQKNPELMLEALNELKEAGLLPRLKIVGEGPLEESLRQKSHALSLEDRVTFAGYVSDVAPLMAESDALILPSRWEGMPNVVLEAMAAGLPAIATDVDGTRELSRNGELCRLFESESVNQLVAAIRELDTHQAAFQARASAAQTHVKKHLTWDSIAQKYSDFYARMLERIA